MQTELKPDKSAVYFEFLDYLRESGQTNMFFAPHVLEATFELSKEDSKKIFWSWTKTFEE
jgi:hypothetical protein